MGILAIPGGAFESVFTPSAGFVNVNGVWKHGWDGNSGDGTGPIKVITPEVAYVVPNWNPATIVDPTTVYNVANISLTLDSNIATDLSGTDGAGVVLLDAAQDGLYVTLKGDEVTAVLGYTRLAFVPLLAGVAGVEIAEYVLPVIVADSVSLDVSYNPFTKEVVAYVDGVFIAKYNYVAAPSALRIGIGAYRGAGAIGYHRSVTTSFDAIPHLKTAVFNDTIYRNTSIVGDIAPITAVTDDYILLDVTYRYRSTDTLTVSTPVWNGQTFTPLGGPTVSSFCATQAFYLKVTTSGTSSVVSNLINGLDEWNLCAGSILVYGGIKSHSFNSPILQVVTKGNTWVQPSAAFASLSMHDIGLTLLNLSGFDSGDNNQVGTVFTPSSNQLQVMHRIPSDLSATYGGELLVSETYGTSAQTATWTAGTPRSPYGDQNYFYNIGLVLSNAASSEDTSPNGFTFTPATDAATSTVITSNDITVAGINAATSITIVGGNYSKNGGGYTASAGTVVLGDTVSVQVTSSATASTAATGTLSIGGITGGFTVTTAAVVSSNTLASVNGSGAVVAGSTIAFVTTGYTAVTGIAFNGVPGTAVTGSGNNYTCIVPDFVDGGAFPATGTITVSVTDGTVVSTLQKTFVQHANQSSRVLTSVPSTGIGYIGYYSTGALAGDVVYFNTPADLSSTSGQTIAINTVDADGKISTDFGGTQTMWLRKAATGTVVELTVLTPAVADIIPDAFSFTDSTNVALSTVSTSNTITVGGVTAATAIAVSISGGTYSKNGSAYTSTAGTVVLGDSIAVRVTSSASFSTAVTTTLTIGGVSDTFSVTTRAVDVTPTALSFTPVTGAALSAVTESNSATIAGIDAGQSIAIAITGGEYAVNTGSGFGAFTASASTVQLGYTVKVRATASGSNNTAVTATLTVGGVANAFVVTTASASDTTPDAFSFTAVTNAAISTVVESAPIVVAGVTAGLDVPISITGGEFAIDTGSGYGAFTTTATVLRLGYSVKVRVTTGSAFNAGTTTTLTIGGVTGTFTATTRVADVTPTAFTFSDVTSAEASTVTESNAIVVAGVDANQNIVVTITGGQYAVDTGSGYGAYTALSTNVQLGHSIKVRATSSASYSTAVNAVLNVGGVSDTFTVTTRAVDLVPSTFTFASVSGAALNAVTESASTTVAGIDGGQSIAISVSNGQYAVNTGSGFGAFTSTAGTVQLGHTVKVRATASGSANTSVTATLTMGTVSGTFTVSTGVAADTTPGAFSFAATNCAEISTNYDSAQTVVAGVTAATDVPISIVGGTYCINSGSGFGAYTSSPGVVRLGYAVKVRVATGSGYGTPNTATLTIGGVSANYVVTTRGADVTPGTFTFTPVTGATVSTLYESNAIAVTGVDANVDVVISIDLAGQYAVNSGSGFGAFTSSVGQVRLGDLVKVNLMSASTIDVPLSTTLVIGGVSGVYSVNTGVVDTTPTPFSFTAANNSEINTVNESNVITVAGVDAGVDVAITITGGSYAINTGSGFGAFVTNPGVVRLGHTVKVRVTTGSAYAAATTATLTVGGVTAAYTANTRAADTTPSNFTLAPVATAVISTDYESNAIIVSGVDSAVDVLISITGGQYSINSGSGFGAYTALAGTVRAGYSVKVKVTSSSSWSNAVSASLNIGGTLGTYTVTTRAADITPTQFSFAPVTSANVSSPYESAPITIAGVDDGVDILLSISNGEYIVNAGSGWGEYDHYDSYVRLGYQVKVLLTSPDSIPATATATLTIGGVSASYVVSTSLVDVTPDPFVFTPVINAATSAPFFSNAITVTGIDADQSIQCSITGGQYRVTTNGVDGPWQFIASTVNLGDVITVYANSASGFGITTNAVLTLGGVPGSFSVTTRAADTSPRAFAFTPLTGAVVDTNYDSNVIVVTSVDAGVDIPVSIIGGWYAIATGTSFSEFTSSPGIIQGGQSIKVRVGSSSSDATATTATLTVGDITGSFTVTTRTPVSNVDDIPAEFTLTPVVNAAMNTSYTANIITVSDVTAGVLLPITVSGASFYIDNGTGYGARLVGSSTVKLGSKVKVVVKSSSYFNTTIIASVNIGGVVSQYAVTTRLPKINPAPITLPRILNAKVSTLYASTQASITGIETGATAVMSTVNGLEYTINRGKGWEAWTSASTPVKTTDLIKTRLKSASVAKGSVVGRLVIANVINTFSIFNK